MLQSDAIADISTALAKAQGAMKPAILNKINPHFKNKYADLSSIIEAIRAPFAANGLSITQTPELIDGSFVLVTTLRHSTGQWISGIYPLPANATAQQLGSALTYAKRYTLSSLACIAADEDDDAEAANKNGNVSTVPSPKINQEQVNSLISFLDEASADKAKFCTYMKIKSIPDLPSARYTEAVAAIEQTQAAKKKHAEVAA
jgi:hypothetical protein